VENVKNLTRAQQNQIAKIKQMRLQVNQFNQAGKQFILYSNVIYLTIAIL